MIDKIFVQLAVYVGKCQVPPTITNQQYSAHIKINQLAATTPFVMGSSGFVDFSTKLFYKISKTNLGQKPCYLVSIMSINEHGNKIEVGRSQLNLLQYGNKIVRVPTLQDNTIAFQIVLQLVCKQISMNIMKQSRLKSKQSFKDLKIHQSASNSSNNKQNYLGIKSSAQMGTLLINSKVKQEISNNNEPQLKQDKEMVSKPKLQRKEVIKQPKQYKDKKNQRQLANRGKIYTISKFPNQQAAPKKLTIREYSSNQSKALKKIVSPLKSAKSIKNAIHQQQINQNQSSNGSLTMQLEPLYQPNQFLTTYIHKKCKPKLK